MRYRKTHKKPHTNVKIALGEEQKKRTCGWFLVLFEDLLLLLLFFFIMHFFLFDKYLKRSAFKENMWLFSDKFHGKKTLFSTLNGHTVFDKAVILAAIEKNNLKNAESNAFHRLSKENDMFLFNTQPLLLVLLVALYTMIELRSLIFII